MQTKITPNKSFSAAELGVPFLVKLQVFVWNGGLGLLESVQEVIHLDGANVFVIYLRKESC